MRTDTNASNNSSNAHPQLLQPQFFSGISSVEYPRHPKKAEQQRGKIPAQTSSRGGKAFAEIPALTARPAKLALKKRLARNPMVWR